jgi:hypothetical protein
VTLYVSKDLFDKLKEEANKHGISISEMNRRILEQYFKGGRQEIGETEIREVEDKPKLPTWHGWRDRVKEMIRKGKIDRELREREVKKWMEKYRNLPLEDLLMEYQGAKFNIQCEAIERILRERGEDISILCNYDREVGE